MKNFMVANLPSNGAYNKHRLDLLLKAQIENSLDLGWRPEDIVIISNFHYEYMGIESKVYRLNDTCMTGSKIFGVHRLYLTAQEKGPIWAHDLDCWQNDFFEEPEYKDIGIAQYSNSKYNGGSLFWRASGVDILHKIHSELIDNEEEREEPALNRILKSDEFKNRVTVVNNTFNVGCSGYVKRYERSVKPVKVLHFHPDNRIAWETHALDRNEIGEIGITVRLERIIRKYYPHLATEVVTKRRQKKNA
jgi:hypothetical protein